jgi:hypothetical protein
MLSWSKTFKTGQNIAAGIPQVHRRGALFGDRLGPKQIDYKAWEVCTPTYAKQVRLKPYSGAR